MRRDLVEEVLSAVSGEMFEDIVFTPAGGGAAVTIEKAIFGVELMRVEYSEFSQRVAEGSHVTRALKAKVPDLARGALINDGSHTYRVLDFKEPDDGGDGRLELLISLKRI